MLSACFSILGQGLEIAALGNVRLTDSQEVDGDSRPVEVALTPSVTPAALSAEGVTGGYSFAGNERYASDGRPLYAESDIGPHTRRNNP